jgi:hypothetical protein
MAGRLETSIWNLTLVAAAAACGPLIPSEDGGDGSNTDGDDDDADDDDTAEDDTTTLPPCVGDDCPECEYDSDCPPDYYCANGQCYYEWVCGAAAEDDVFRCSPGYECYDDSWCDDGESCVNYYCEPTECPAGDAFDVVPLEVPRTPVVDLAFVNLDSYDRDELAIASPSGLSIVAPAGEVFSIDFGGEIVAFDRADLDGDGDVDIVAVDRVQGLIRLVNSGDGAFVLGESIPTVGMPIDVVLGDPENDGNVDAFVRSDVAIVRHADLGEPSVVVAEPTSAMALAGWSLAYSTAFSTWWLPVATLQPTDPTELPGGSSFALVAAEVDGNGDRDVLGARDARFSTELTTWLGPIGSAGNTAYPEGAFSAIGAADFANDGRADAVLVRDVAIIVLPDAAPNESCDVSIPIEVPGAHTIATGQFTTGGQSVAIGNEDLVYVVSPWSE